MTTQGTLWFKNAFICKKEKEVAKGNDSAGRRQAFTYNHIQTYIRSICVCHFSKQKSQNVKTSSKDKTFTSKEITAKFLSFLAGIYQLVFEKREQLKHSMIQKCINQR